MQTKIPFDLYTEIITKKGGVCLSNSCNNADDKITMRCMNGHEWTTRARSIREGHWCQKCIAKKTGEKNRTPFNNYLEIIQKKGGKCLSTSCNHGGKDRIHILCTKGHEWTTTGQNLKNGCWCPHCQRLSLDEIKEFIKPKGWICLSDNYSNAHEHLTFQCKNKHIWKSSFAHIKYGKRKTGCPFCSKHAKITLEEMRDLAKARGGVCLAEKMVTLHTKVGWKCKNGHEWKATGANVKYHVSWCPQCYEPIGETTCRNAFEKIFNKKFPKTKPKWLISLKGKQMELDGFCQELNVAFEYQGEQHYYPLKFFNQKQNNKLDIIKNRDQHKKKTCEERGIKLFIIPYTIKHSRLEEHISTIYNSHFGGSNG